MSKTIFYGFILYWLLAIPLAIHQKKNTTKPILKYLYGLVLPKDYQMFTTFSTRIGKLEYFFHNDRDTVCINAIKSSRKFIKNDFPLVSMNYKLFSKFVVNTRMLDRDYAHFYFNTKINSPLNKKDSLPLKLNNHLNKRLVSLYKEMRKIIIKNEKIDTLEYPNYYFTIKTYHLGTKNTHGNNLSRRMGTQLILDSKN